MNLLRALSVLWFLGCAPQAGAQIYADFAVSYGGSPLGTFRARLDYDKAPRTCANFIGLATGRRPWIDITTGGLKTNTPFYDGMAFHRLIHNFIIQGGSPNGLGTDSPGYVIQDEYEGTLRHSGRYFLSMAKSSLPNTGGSQFFITLAAASHLDDKHSVFGEVISGKAIIDGFTNATTYPTAGDKPVTPIVMNSVTISGPSLAGFDIDAPSLLLPVLKGQQLVGDRDSPTTFRALWNRKPRVNYVSSYSENLVNWTPLANSLSLDSETAYPLALSGVTEPKFFMRMASVDYGALPNPVATLAAGAKLEIRDRSANKLTITFNGAGGGAWVHSNGGSGTLTALTYYDGAAASGISSTTSMNAHLIPLTQLIVSFNTPAGPAAWTGINVVLSHNSATTGWAEGSATTTGVGVAVQQAFTWLP